MVRTTSATPAGRSPSHRTSLAGKPNALAAERLREVDAVTCGWTSTARTFLESRRLLPVEHTLLPRFARVALGALLPRGRTRWPQTAQRTSLNEAATRECSVRRAKLLHVDRPDKGLYCHELSPGPARRAPAQGGSTGVCQARLGGAARSATIVMVRVVIDRWN
jgi:hypothetical protein